MAKQIVYGEEARQAEGSIVVAAEGSIVVAKVKAMDAEEGFNALNGKYENLVDAGVIDPTKVVRSALENSASIASLLLTTEALVSEIPQRKDRATSDSSDIAGMY